MCQCTSSRVSEMDENIPTVNMVVYLLAGTDKGASRNKTDSYLGGYGYTYDLTEEGKKKLVKDVATSTGYYTGNPQRPNTVITVKDIVSLTVAQEHSQLEALFKGLITVLDKFLDDNSEYRNLYVITPFKELDYLLKSKDSQLEGEDRLKLGKTELTVAESILARTCYQMVKALDRKPTPGVVIVDLDASAEGGLGIREATKQAELAEVITRFSTAPEITLTIVTKKVHENPETDFVKLVCATKWFLDTHNKDDFYKKNGEYRVYDFGKVEPKKGYYGKITPDVTYSRLYSLEPIEMLDKLFDFMVKRVANPEGYLAAGDLRTITSKDIARMIDSTPGVPENRALISPITRGNDKPVLIEMIVPVQMSYRIRESLLMLDIVLKGFLEKDENNTYGHLRFKNITDMIYVKEVNGKGVTKLKLHPDFTQTKTVFNVEVEHPKAVKPVNIMLSVGFDIPDRNSFNSVEDPNTEVWVVTDVRNDTGIRYLTLVKTDSYIYIHTSDAANLKVLSLAELGKKK